jgi:N-acetylneuraminic acid mutarotase
VSLTALSAVLAALLVAGCGDLSSAPVFPDGGHRDSAASDSHSTSGPTIDAGSDGTSASSTTCTPTAASGGTPDSGIAGSIVLFGGFDIDDNEDATSLADTWTWNGAVWAQQNVGGPGARGGALAASLDGLVVMVGGSDDDVSPLRTTLSDMWVWDGLRWAPQGMVGLPAANAFGTMARLGGAIMLFGGAGDFRSDYAAVATSFTFDGDDWTQETVSGPSARYGAISATTARCGTIVLFGGTGGIPGYDLLNDTWVWNGALWTELQVPAPPPRAWSAAAALNGTVVLFGGLDDPYSPFIPPDNRNVLGDTWVWDGARWTQENVSGPSPRAGHAMATLNGEVILFGGMSMSGAPLGDTWAWDGSAWTQLDVVGPSARAFTTMAGP